MMAIEKDSEFFKMSKEIVGEFLQTTVIVDDKIEYTNSYEKSARLLQIPGRQTATNGAVINEDNDNPVPFEEPNGHILIADLVISGFAEKGIICSVFGPNNDQEILQIDIINLANNADVLVLDWELAEEDDGVLALETLAKVTEDSNAYPAQLRLIVIYTGTPDIHHISNRIKEHFGEKIQELGDFTFDIDATRITIYVKGHVNVDPNIEHRKVRFERLVDFVISDFTEMNAGLVSNTVLKALSVVRQNTKKILKKFSAHLDAPYLTHRALLVSTEDAENLLAGLISEEIKSILEEGYVGQVANLEVIKDWLSLHNKTVFTLRFGDNIKEIPLEKIVALLEVGINEWDEITNKQRNKSQDLPFTEMFKFDTDDNQFLDEEFCFITTNRSYYENMVPELTFGTIVQKVRDESYWVCLQPRCDSVRIEDERAFPFLPLAKVDKNKKFNLTLKENDKFIRLFLHDNLYEISLIPFAPEPATKKIVSKSLDKDGYYFISSKRSAQYKWVGELRFEQAQRIANKFASNLSRVGLDESEWLRRNMPK